jgi:ribosome-associated toxin RatA of RatAB toxin-antitoxin module
MYDFDDFTTPFRPLDRAAEDLDPTEEMNLAGLDLLGDQALTTTLPVSASIAYEIFCDVEQVPRWVSVIKSARVLEANPRGRPRRATFLASLARASIGYTLEYRYIERERIVTWSTPKQSSTQVAGRARFDPLGERACLMHYELVLEVPDALPAWSDDYFDGHAASAVLADFRDYLSRVAPMQ